MFLIISPSNEPTGLVAITLQAALQLLSTCSPDHYIESSGIPL